MELERTTPESAHIIRNLWPLYVHDIAAYDGTKPNPHGVLSPDVEARTWPGPGDWWHQGDVLAPYLIRVDGVPAGFSLIASGAFVPTDGVDHVVHEFFIAHGFRGTGVAQAAARESLRRHPGRWEIVTYPNAHGPQAFWRKTLPACGVRELRETEEDHPWGRKVVWRFRKD